MRVSRSLTSRAGDVAAIVDQRERHPKCLGKVDEVEYLDRQTRAVFDRAGIRNPLDLPKTTILQECLDRDPESLIAEIETSGLRGRGGAGFPAHIKWRTVFDTPGEQKYIVCNADEGDSGTFADRLLMEGDPHRLIEGDDHRGYRHRRDPWLRLPSLRIPRRRRNPAIRPR